MAAAAGDWIPDVPEGALLLFGQHFEIGDGREQHRVPVDETLATVDQAFVVQAYEYLGHRAREVRIHRELVARPVDRRAEAAHLPRDRAAGFFLPFPDAFEELFASEVEAMFAFGAELALDHHLRRDAGMVGSGLPQRGIAAHAMPACECVHECVLECMTHVQRAGDVWRRQHDAIAFAITLRREGPGRFPTLVDAGFDFARCVSLVHEGADYTGAKMGTSLISRQHTTPLAGTC